VILLRTIIIGGVAAGMSTASKLRRLDKDADIIVFEKGRDLSYSGCGMPYYLGDIIKDEDSLVAKTYEDFKKENIDVRLYSEVISVNPKDKTVLVKDLKTNQETTYPYDKLLVATGTYPIRTNVEGSSEVDVLVLNQLEDMRVLKPYIKKGNEAVIIGAGYIGIELAENLVHQGMTVRIIELQDQVLSVYDKDIANKAYDILVKAGVLVHTGEKLVRYEKKGNKALVYTDKDVYETDIVVESVGVRPATQFLKDTGIDMLKNGAIITDDYCETNIKDIYAAGDCAAYKHLLKDELAYVPLGTHANKAGRVVANNIAGIPTTFNGIVGSNIIKVFDYAFAKTGIGIDEARKLNLDYDYVDITSNHKSGYYPGVEKIFVRVVFEKGTGILKGASLVGKSEIAPRINIMALAITKNLTADEFSQLDFAYAPPFSALWDPLQVATNQIKV
jgi:NADPH-dependent 2,4-dienoyl-CoA reductase/sulfur reductase-like enzyme